MVRAKQRLYLSVNASKLINDVLTFEQVVSGCQRCVEKNDLNGVLPGRRPSEDLLSLLSGTSCQSSEPTPLLIDLTEASSNNPAIPPVPARRKKPLRSYHSVDDRIFASKLSCRKAPTLPTTPASSYPAHAMSLSIDEIGKKESSDAGTNHLVSHSKP